MTALASVADLSAYIGREIAEDDASALLALDLASGAVREYCGQYLSLVEDESITLNGSGTRVVLMPETPVTEVTSVSVSGETLETEKWSWTAEGVLNRISGTWPTAARSIVVVYSHGFAEIPAAVKAVVLSVASRVLDSPAAVKQESIGAYSVTYTNGAPTLLDSETGALSRYRVN